MKKTIITALFCFVLASVMPTAAYAMELVVGGQAVGIQLSTDGVMVAGLAAIETAEGEKSPAADAGFREGDIIVKIGERKVSCAADFIDAVAALNGESAQVTAQRNGKTLQLTVQPVLSNEDQWMLGMWLKDGISGIGTLTFCDPDTGVYGALGHSVNDEDTGAILPLGDGSISSAEIVGVVPGAQGTPGELNGCADTGQVLGSVEKNTEKGIYGQAYVSLGGRVVETGEIHPGSATILSTVKGREPCEYAVEINRVYSENGCTRVMLTVTDPELCAATGGIVQGMSGSPILQDGCLVGAVTHVFVNEPTKGYGISIQDMLETAEIENQAA